MDLSILPLKIVTFQALILLVAIATEASIFKFRLKLPHKTAVEYATFINLFSACVGWGIFLSLLSVLPDILLDRLMTFIILGYDTGLSWTQGVAFLLFFLISLLLKLIGMQLLEFFWFKKPVKDSFKFNLEMPSFKNSQSTIAMVAHIISHLLIVLIWLIQTNEL
ncbi:MAG: hypothetical protein SXA11_16080 [Cyanobacteriota bacterium]|nr:hypothetical protein [Cyanobacteriota bacterium]